MTATHTSEGSVSRAFSTSTDVRVAAGLFLAALALGAAASRVDLRPRR